MSPGKYDEYEVIPSIEKEILLKFDNQHPFWNRVVDTFTTVVIRPSGYKISSRLMSTEEFNEAYRAEAMMHGQRPFNILPNSLRGIVLYVGAFNNLLTGKDSQTPLLSMGVVANTQSKTFTLAFDRLTSWIRVGKDNFQLHYRRMESETDVVLAAVCPMYHCTNNLFTEGKPLKVEEVERLSLDRKGFPKNVDWFRTFQMYILAVRPDEDGEIKAQSQPLRAEDIYTQPLLPMLG